MQTSVPGELRWRLDLYQRCFAACRQGRFSYARLLALPPERLRLAAGDRGARTVVPYAFDADLTDRLDDLLPGPRGDLHPRAVPDDQLRRAIRLAQLDADIAPRAVAQWLDKAAASWLAVVADVQTKGLKEVGRGEGGLETAYLVHVVLASRLRDLLDRRGASEAQRAWTAAALELAMEAIVNTDRVKDDVPMRLALQTSVTTSALTLGADATAFERRPLSAYRTHPVATRLARRVLVPPLEIIDLERVVSTLARRLVVDEQTRRALLSATLLELVHDALLLAYFKSLAPGRELVPLEEALANEKNLTQVVFNEPRRRRFLAWLSEAPIGEPRARDAAVKLLNGVPQVERGESRPLGVHGDVAERATLAARGAVAMMLDRHTAHLGSTIRAPLLEVDDDRKAYERGAHYRVAVDEGPLFVLPSSTTEAVLYVDTTDLVARVASSGPRSIQQILQRHVHSPANELQMRIGAAGRDLRCVECHQRGIAYAGDVVGIVALAEALDEAVLTRIEETFGRSTHDALGGRSSRLAEIEEERDELTRRLQELSDEAERSFSAEETMHGRLVIEDRLQMLTAEANALDPPLPIVNACVAWGATGTEDDDAWYAPALLEASEATMRRKGASAVLDTGFTVEVGDGGLVHNGGVLVTSSALDAYARNRRGMLERVSVELSARQLKRRGATGERFVVLRSPTGELRLVLRALAGHPYFELIGKDSRRFTNIIEAIGSWT
ncbi:MAG: hypothetical protein RIT81_33205 [Deltaproteobacteria bacterium]